MITALFFSFLSNTFPKNRHIVSCRPAGWFHLVYYTFTQNCWTLGGLWRSVSRNEAYSVLAGWCRGETRSVRRDMRGKYGHVSKCCCNKEWKSNSSLIRPAGIDVLLHIREGVARPFVRIDESDSDSMRFGSSECSRLISWPLPFLFRATLATGDVLVLLLFGKYRLSNFEGYPSMVKNDTCEQTNQHSGLFDEVSGGKKGYTFK